MAGAAAQGYFPSAKKLFQSHMHQNSDEFKELGTLTKDQRITEYYPTSVDMKPGADKALRVAEIRALNAVSSPRGAGG